MFVGRKKELATLEKLYKRKNFEMAVIYGRRRVGKTTLIKKFIEGKNHIFFVANQTTAKDNLERISSATFKQQGFDTAPAFQSYHDLIQYIIELSKKERLILVIDEYPYLAESEPSISSILQEIIDHDMKYADIMLILCGSSMSFMENQILGHQSPLFGRRTAQLRLEPFTIFETAEMLQGIKAEEVAIYFGISGGIPNYLSFIEPFLTIEENIIEMFLDSHGRLFEEPSNLLKQELREPAIYNAILNAIAEGASKLNEIATKVGISTAACSANLSALISLGIVRKEIPITEKSSSRKTIYILRDNMFRFWYKFVFPNLTNIVAGQGKKVYQNKIKDSLSEFMGSVFETIATEYMLELLQEEQQDFSFEKIGRWWGTNPHTKSQEEIDIVAQNDKKTWYCECKWKNVKTGIHIYEALREKSTLIPAKERHYVLFSKSGFTEDLIDKAKKEPAITLVTLQDIVK